MKQILSHSGLSEEYKSQIRLTNCSESSELEGVAKLMHNILLTRCGVKVDELDSFFQGIRIDSTQKPILEE